MNAAASPLERWREASRRRRARREARALTREVRGSLRRHGYRIPDEIQGELAGAADRLDAARANRDHDQVCAGLARLDDLVERHLSFARKSTFREYAESIGVAVLIALLLRAFVVEAFKIPSGSMIPTMEVGDHIFVNKFTYGLRIPFTKIRFFEYNKPRRGDVIVFIYPKEPEKDFIKRIVGVEGDSVAVRNGVLYVNDEPVPQQVRRRPGQCHYTDWDDNTREWFETRTCKVIDEELDGVHYTTVVNTLQSQASYPRADGEPCPGTIQAPTRDRCIVPPGTVFVMGDNRSNSHDSRYWGPVPVENIKGKALVIWWSSGNQRVRWERLGKLVE